MQLREKGGMSTLCFPMIFVAPEGRKVGSLKQQVRRQLGRWEMTKCTPLWREARLEVKSVSTRRSQTAFGSLGVEKVQAVVARSTFRSKKRQNTSGSDDFWKLRCRKVHTVVARSTFGSQYVESTMRSDHFLNVEMLKQCNPLWQKAHFPFPSQKRTKAIRGTF